METIYLQTVALNDATVAGLCSVLQQAASAHQEHLGTGQKEMRHRGLLWMIVRQKLMFDRQPMCGESVTVRTWLSEVRHGMLLRQYEVTGTDGAVICRAAAVWTLVDAEKRTMTQMALDVPLVQQEGQLPRFPLLRPMKMERRYSFTVPREYLDENGHMNNARYFDAVASILPNGVLREVQADYHAEAREGETLDIGYALQKKNLLIQAQGGRGLCFRMKWEYE